MGAEGQAEKRSIGRFRDLIRDLLSQDFGIIQHCICSESSSDWLPSIPSAQPWKHRKTVPKIQGMRRTQFSYHLVVLHGCCFLINSLQWQCARVQDKCQLPSAWWVQHFLWLPVSTVVQKSLDRKTFSYNLFSGFLCPGPV